MCTSTTSRKDYLQSGDGAPVEAQEEALEAMDSGNILGIVTLDQSAAFDIIEHRILEEKMKLYGFNEQALRWFQSYLNDRSQYVALESSVP